MRAFKTLALLLALLTAPVQAQTGLETQYFPHCNPYPLTLTDQVVVTRAGVTCNALYNISALPIATLTTNGVGRPDGTTISINAAGQYSTIAAPDNITIGSLTTANPHNSGEVTSGFYTPTSNTIAIELNGAPAMRWKTLSAGVDYLTVTPGKSGTTAKIGLGGTTTNQGLDLTATGSGSVSINGVAFSSAQIISNGTWQGNVIQPSYLAVATSAATGIGRPDNSTITVSGGVWSAVASGTAASFNATTSSSAYQISGLNTMIFPNGDNTSIAVGNGALSAQSAASAGNTALGYHAGAAVTSGTANTFIGKGIAASGTETGVGNTVAGNGAATTITSGAGNAIYGYLAGAVNAVTGANNAWFGASINAALSTTASSVAMGYGVVVGSKDVGIGAGALASTSTNNNANVAMGFNAGNKLTTGTSNVVIGPGVATTTLTIGSNNILLGTSSGLDTTTSSISNYFSINNGTNPLAWATSTNAVAPLHVPGGLFGTTTSDSACTGCLGEYLSSTTTLGQKVALSTASSTGVNVASVVLTAGDWDVWGSVYYDPAAATLVSGEYAMVSTTSGTLAAALPGTNGYGYMNNPWTAGQSSIVVVTPIRASLNATTTYYMVGAALFSTSTNAAFGSIAARRVR